MPSETLDPSGPVPLYHQIDLLIRHRITSGHYADAEILPSEHALAEEFGVSRITIARALNNLAQGGLVKRRRGSGTAVTLPAGQKRQWANIEHLNHTVSALARMTRLEVLEHGVIAAQTDQAECLRLAPGDSLQRTVRVRYLEQAPISHLLSYIPTEIAAGFDKRRMAHYTVTELLTAAGHTVAAVTQRFVAIAAESELAQRLDVQIGTPLLRIERVAYDAQDVPLQLLYATYATERYRPSIRLAGHSATENFATAD